MYLYNNSDFTTYYKRFKSEKQNSKKRKSQCWYWETKTSSPYLQMSITERHSKFNVV